VAALGSGSIYAATVAVAGPLTERNPPLLITTAATVVGAVVIVPIVAIKSSGAGMGVGHGPSTLIGLAYLGAFTMALAYGLFYAGLRTTPQRSAVIATLLEPVTAVIASALILGERLDLGAAIGAAMILGSVVLLWLRNQKTRPIPIRA
jgi:drug/metabolite transporter, DME family